jgi:hypothetical protein
MKKGLLSKWVVVLVASLLLSACSSGTKSAGTTSGSGATGGAGTLSSAAQLLVGTLKLEDSDNAVTTNQAADLLPLWQAYSQLSASDSAAQAEIDAVLAQIKSTMTDQQIQAIAAMKLTQKDMLTQMGVLGFDPNATPASGTAQAFPASGFAGGFTGGAGGPPSGGAASSGGGAPAGGFAAGGDPGGGVGGAITGQAGSTPVAGAKTRPNAIPSILINALIDLLQKRAAS